MATTKTNTRTTRKPATSNKTTETTDDKSTGTDETVVTGEAGATGAGDAGAGDTNTGTGTEGAGEEGSESGDTSTGTDGDNAGAEGSESTGATDTGAGNVPEGDDSALEVLMTNNSVSGHEILRADGSILAINGHCKDLSITTNKEELIAIQSALADKPWVEIKLKAE
ncbi:hypothetical protein [Vibrio parahaemolyticus]|uniref:hypothetical protein n=1 Tax=Vibrio parahaemolyticus TaxID=670 RepID=UPI0009F072E3|nr:hypothetical protein [Vibrio parahaemolyticus]EJG0621800.1 hypothetical protein [Vibrio parahaemolyticus]OQU45639.1 hypothetical protein EN02_024190 [Vibrio parahaemolyticus]